MNWLNENNLYAKNNLAQVQSYNESHTYDNNMILKIFFCLFYLVWYFLRTSKVVAMMLCCSPITLVLSCSIKDIRLRTSNTSMRRWRKQTTSFDLRGFKNAIPLAFESTDTLSIGSDSWNHRCICWNYVSELILNNKIPKLL